MIPEPRLHVLCDIHLCAALVIREGSEEPLLEEGKWALLEPGFHRVAEEKVS